MKGRTAEGHGAAVAAHGAVDALRLSHIVSNKHHNWYASRTAC